MSEHNLRFVVVKIHGFTWGFRVDNRSKALADTCLIMGSLEPRAILRASTASSSREPQSPKDSAAYPAWSCPSLNSRCHYGDGRLTPIHQGQRETCGDSDIRISVFQGFDERRHRDLPHFIVTATYRSERFSGLQAHRDLLVLQRLDQIGNGCSRLQATQPPQSVGGRLPDTVTRIR